MADCAVQTNKLLEVEQGIVGKEWLDYPSYAEVVDRVIIEYPADEEDAD
jgi:hypothetical protein